MQTDTIIVGGGLAGLYGAWRLRQAGVEFKLLEARERLGGRIHGVRLEASQQPNESFDLGPSWFWPSFQPNIIRLLSELGLGSFEQYYQGDALFERSDGQIIRSPESNAMQGSYRIRGGTSALIDALASAVGEDRIDLGRAVNYISMREDGRIDIRVAGEQQPSITARRVVMALPPRLLARTIKFDPTLPPALEKAFVDTATWMAGHAKIIAMYETPFWRNKGLSGEAFSQRGPMTEIHDASPESGGPYALFGFVGYPASARQSMGEEQVLAIAREQLERMYGPEAASTIRMVLKDWATDPFTATRDDEQPVYSHPKYGLPSAVDDLYDGRVMFTATEAIEENGGYLEGAINAASRAIDRILR